MNEWMHPSLFKILVWCTLLCEAFLDTFPLLSTFWVLSLLELASPSSPSCSNSLFLAFGCRSKGAWVGVHWTQSWFPGRRWKTSKQQPRQWEKAFQEGGYGFHSLVWHLMWPLEAEPGERRWYGSGSCWSLYSHPPKGLAFLTISLNAIWWHVYLVLPKFHGPPVFPRLSWH